MKRFGLILVILGAVLVYVWVSLNDKTITIKNVDNSTKLKATIEDTKTSSTNTLNQTTTKTFDSSKYQIIKGNGYSFEIPLDWEKRGVTTVNGCEDITVADNKITGGDNYPGQIDVWPKSCFPEDTFSYDKKTQVGNFVIITNFDSMFATPKSEILSVYNHVIETFKTN